MARGWESKSVEAQREAAESGRGRRGVEQLTPEQRERGRRRDGLMLSRTRVLTDIRQTCNARYRGMLEQSLAHLDAEIAKLDAGK
jgi:hypothetical protein